MSPSFRVRHFRLNFLKFERFAVLRPKECTLEHQILSVTQSLFCRYMRNCINRVANNLERKPCAFLCRQDIVFCGAQHMIVINVLLFNL